MMEEVPLLELGRVEVTPDFNHRVKNILDLSLLFKCKVFGPSQMELI